MRTIIYYKLDGTVTKKEELTKKSITDCHGMKVRCTLIDGSIRVGYANAYYSFEKNSISINDESINYLTLETFVNLDEETHKFVGDDKEKFDVNREAVAIDLITHIDAILYSGVRWGGCITNKFNINI